MAETTKLKRFLLFAFDEYYPAGGWYDFKGSFKHISEARDYFLNNCTEEFYQIVDIKTGEVVDEGTREYLKKIRERPGRHPFKGEEKVMERIAFVKTTGQMFVRRKPVTQAHPSIIAQMARFAEEQRRKRLFPKGEASNIFIYALPLVLLGIIVLKNIFA